MMREPRAVGWMKYFDGRIAFEKYSAFIPDDALSLGWRKLYTDDALQAAAVEAQNQQARIAELEAENLAFAKDSNLVAAENARLREAAQSVVDSATPHYDRWVNEVTRIRINRLAALLGGGE